MPEITRREDLSMERNWTQTSSKRVIELVREECIKQRLDSDIIEAGCWVAEKMLDGLINKQECFEEGVSAARAQQERRDAIQQQTDDLNREAFNEVRTSEKGIFN